MRLNRFLAKAGAAPSRRKADELIASGHVFVNGQPAASMGVDVDPEQDVITIGTKRLTITKERILIALHKPAGYDTSRSDPHAKRVVYVLLPASVRDRVHAVGRLDRDTSGLLLFTNDGDLTQVLTHPSHGHEKEYQLTIEGPLADAERHALENGIRLEDGLTAPAKVHHVRVEKASNATTFLLTIGEGRNRQVRRMCESIGLNLLALQRLKVGPFELGTLPEGKWRFEDPKLLDFLD